VPCLSTIAYTVARSEPYSRWGANRSVKDDLGVTNGRCIGPDRELGNIGLNREHWATQLVVFAHCDTMGVGGAERNLSAFRLKVETTCSGRGAADNTEGENGGGAIAEKWKPAGTPTFYIIDPKGVMRYKWAGAPGKKAIDTALERLIKEAEGSGKRVPK
jgi:hypothetical protein